MENKIKMQSFSYEGYNNKYSIDKYCESYDKKRNIINWGSDNNYPDYLLSLFNTCPLHSSILKKKAMMIGGNGWNKNNLSQPALDFLKNSEDTRYKLDADEIVSLIAMDMEWCNGFYFWVTFSADFSKIIRYGYVPVSKVRISKETEDNKQFYLVSDNWNDNKSVIQEFAAYDPEIRNRFNDFIPSDEQPYFEENTTVIHFEKVSEPGNNFYPIPDYISGEKSIITDSKISEFHLSSLENGYFPAQMITLIGPLPNEEHRSEIAAKMKKEIARNRDKGATVIFYAEDADSAPKIESIEQKTSDDLFVNLNNEVRDKIIYAHQITDPELVGINVPGELGSKNDLQTSLAVFQSSYITPRQRIIEKIFNWFANFNGITDKFEIEQYKLNIPVETNSTELTNLITNPDLSVEQKKVMLSLLGYDSDTIDKLIPNLIDNNTNLN